MAYAQLFGLDASAVTENNFETVFGNLLEGVFLGIDNECRVYASAVPGASVEVNTGVFITGGVFGRVSVAETVAVPAAAGGNVRCDRIVLRRDNTTDTLALARLAGAEIAAPGPPVCPALTRAGGIYEISLARVYVDAAGVVSENDVTDERGEPTLCGYVSGKAYEQVARGQVEGNRQQGGWSGYGHATQVAFQGLYLTGNPAGQCIDNASAALQDADGVALTQTTLNVAGNYAYTVGADDPGVINAPCHCRDYWSVFECKFKPSVAANLRLFVGLSDQVLVANIIGVDDPGGSYAGLQFCHGAGTRGDTNFQWVHENAGGGQVLVDSNYAPVAGTAYIFRLTFRSDGAYAHFELLDTNRNVLASYWTNAATLPPVATRMLPWSGIETRAAAAISISQYYANGVNRNT